ncbi:hypothetical protein Tco_1200755 [Tanacetum coccineum]
MESQTALELECWSNHEIIPNEDEFYSFQHQLPPLDLSPYDLMHVQQDHYLDDHDGYNMMDSMLPNPMFSSIDVLPASYKKRKAMGLAPSVTNSSTSNVTTQLSSSCSSNHAGYDVMEDGYGGDYDEQEEIKSILYTDCLPSSNNDLF